MPGLWYILYNHSVGGARGAGMHGATFFAAREARDASGSAVAVVEPSVKTLGV